MHPPSPRSTSFFFICHSDNDLLQGQQVALAVGETTLTRLRTFIEITDTNTNTDLGLGVGVTKFDTTLAGGKYIQ